MLNPWAWLQYAHNMCGAVVTASFVVAATGAFYLLEKSHEEFGRLFLKIGVIAGLISCIVQIFPTGDFARPLRREVSARGDRRHGRPLPHPEGRARRPHRPARRERAEDRQSCWPINDVLSFLHLRNHVAPK